MFDDIKKVRRLDSEVEAELPTDDADSGSEICEEARVKSIRSDCERQNCMAPSNVHRPTLTSLQLYWDVPSGKGAVFPR